MRNHFDIILSIRTTVRVDSYHVTFRVVQTEQQSAGKALLISWIQQYTSLHSFYTRHGQRRKIQTTIRLKQPLEPSFILEHYTNTKHRHSNDPCKHPPS